MVTSASCTISKKDLDSGCKTNDATQTYARKLGDPGDDAGHILAHRLGGRCSSVSSPSGSARELESDGWPPSVRATPSEPLVFLGGAMPWAAST